MTTKKLVSDTQHAASQKVISMVQHSCNVMLWRLAQLITTHNITGESTFADCKAFAELYYQESWRDCDNKAEACAHKSGDITTADGTVAHCIGGSVVCNWQSFEDGAMEWAGKLGLAPEVQTLMGACEGNYDDIKLVVNTGVVDALKYSENWANS